MALVCDIKSDNIQPPQQQEPSKEETPSESSDPTPSTDPSPSSAAPPPPNEDLEDGEIEDDDDDDDILPEPAAAATTEQIKTTSQPQPNSIITPNNKFSNPNENKFSHNNRNIRFDRTDRHINRYEERSLKRTLTEAEKSVQHLHKIERLEREKRERYKRDTVPVVDDFASNIEKAIANVLKKDKKQISEDEKDEEEKRGKKRKKKDKDKKKAKQRRTSPKAEEYDENEMMNIRKGSPDMRIASKERTRSPSPRSDYDSYDSSTSSDRSRDDRKEWKRDHVKKRSRSRNKDRVRGDRKNRDKNREKKTDSVLKEGLCQMFLLGTCNKNDDCPYSHETHYPTKLELCKFYLMDCCAKRDKCLYMHSEFPCKFYHTGLRCQAGENCKFAHGKPLSEGLRQILFKHIETAPKEILGDFPRLSREGALNMINQAQKALETKYGGGNKDAPTTDTSGRSIIPSLFELNIPVPTELLSKDGENAKGREKNEKPSGRERNRPSRWQDADPTETLVLQEQQKQQQLQVTFGLKGFYSDRGDQDMRINSNGDVDMRTLPPQLNSLVPPALVPTVTQLSTDNLSKVDINQYMRDAGLLKDMPKQDVDIRPRPQDVDIRQLTLESQVNLAMDVDIRHIPQFDTQMSIMSNTDNDDNDNAADEPNLEIVVEDDTINQKAENDCDMINKGDVDNRLSGFDNKDTDIRSASDFPANLPKKQRELFLRIQAQQKENVPEHQKEAVSDEDKNIDWYSDDDDDCRLTIKDDIEDAKPQKADENFDVSSQPAPIKPVEVIEKLGDLSKIDISEEVTKLLSSISQGNVVKEIKADAPKDPRLSTVTQQASTNAKTLAPADPRRARVSSTESKKIEKISIYEQGSISIENASKDIDLRSIERDMDLRPTFGDTDLRPPSGRPDIDLRQLGLPFKAIQNYTPASEIDANINSHGPMPWKVYIVDIPRPDYTGLKLSAHDAQTTGDPRLRKIFRLSTEEKDSPASPKESPKATTPIIRTDPRRRREEKSGDTTAQMNYAQQLSVLQKSAFYQSLTSSQKVLLNEELSTRADHSGSNDPTLNGILTNLGLINTLIPNVNTAANTSALSILATVNNMNPMMPQTQMMQTPGLIAQNQNQSFVSQSVNPNILQQNPNIVNQMAQSIVQPGLLGAAPGVPNLPPDFQLNFDPRQGGLLGNAPPIPFNDNNPNYNYNEDYYEGNNFVEGGVGARGSGRGGNAGGSGGGRGGFRDRPRRGRNFNNNHNNRNNGGGRNFRNRNRSNRSRTPP